MFPGTGKTLEIRLEEYVFPLPNHPVRISTVTQIKTRVKNTKDTCQEYEIMSAKKCWVR